MATYRWSRLMRSLDVLRQLDAEATEVVETWIYGALDDVAGLSDDIAALRQDLRMLTERFAAGAAQWVPPPPTVPTP